MENFKELAISEMVDVSGGNMAYNLGYNFGNMLRDTWHMIVSSYGPI